MRRALELAVCDDAPRGLNPRVGCVLVKDFRIIGEGHHRGAGTPHAEVDALLSADESILGATAIVTLEPCAHYGRTGPCADALIEAGVSTVVFAQDDPTSEASGGAGRLRDAGIEVISGVLLEEATSVNADWMFVKSTGRPFVTLKLASSLDGKVDSIGSERLVLTGPQAQVSVHQLRARMDAIAVGAGTLAADDPRLTVRGVDLRSQPLRVILGSGSIPPDARVLEAAGEALVVTERDPRLALEELARRGIQRVLLEGGPIVAASYLDAGIVDEVYWYISAILVGSGTGALTSLSAQIALDVTGIDVVGEDVCIVGVPIRRES